jgi:hypothetical protein
MSDSKKQKGRRGQTSVEYILLLAMITGVFAVVNIVLEPEIAKNVAVIVDMVRSEATFGGKPATEDEPYGYYYNTGQMEVK